VFVVKRENRFLGPGNFVIGDGHSRTKAWRLECVRCHEIKVVAMPNGTIPPEAVLKRFVQNGWHVGKRPDDDVCGGCQHKERAAEHAPKLNGATIPVSDELVMSALRKEIAAMQARATEAYKREQAASLKVAEDQVVLRRLHELLTSGRVADAIQAIETHMPSWPWHKKPNGAAAKPKADDFDRWLTDLDKSHRAGPRP
jgi:hypothetical protein